MSCAFGKSLMNCGFQSPRISIQGVAPSKESLLLIILCLNFRLNQVWLPWQRMQVAGAVWHFLTLPDKQSVGGGTESCSTESLINGILWLRAIAHTRHMYLTSQSGMLLQPENSLKSYGNPYNSSTEQAEEHQWHERGADFIITSQVSWKSLSVQRVVRFLTRDYSSLQRQLSGVSLLVSKLAQRKHHRFTKISKPIRVA